VSLNRRIAALPIVAARSRAAEAGVGVVSGDVDVLAARLLRTRRRALEVNVGAEQVLDPDQRPGREVEDYEFI
jgi:hypothetical protein